VRERETNRESERKRALANNAFAYWVVCLTLDEHDYNDFYVFVDFLALIKNMNISDDNSLYIN